VFSEDAHIGLLALQHAEEIAAKGLKDVSYYLFEGASIGLSL
jgi:hypothetical protein